MTDSLWQDVLSDIKKSTSSSNGKFSVFLENSSFISFDNNRLVIGVTNIFIQANIDKNFGPAIKKSLSDYGVTPAAIEYVIRKSDSKKAASVHDEVVAVVDHVSRAVPKSKQPFESGLNPRYQFSNFIVGSNNDLAYTVCQSVVKSPGTKYNPLFLYGGSGLGKTHLMQAVGNKIIEENPKSVVLYTTIESFYKEFIDSMRLKKPGFTDRYRNVDVLIVDDMQFIAGKDKSQDEFFHTFNDLQQKNKQIIISSDKPPKDIATLADRLRTRFEGGMTIDIQMPDFETRCAIIQAKASASNVELKPDVVEFLANNIKTNIRELEGSLNQLLAYCEMRGTEPDLATAEGLLSNSNTSSRPRYLTPKQVITKTSQYFQINPKDMCSASRSQDVCQPRQIAMYLLRTELKLSYPKIASEFGRKDHTTAMSGIRKIEKAIKLDYLIREQVNEVREKLYA